MSSPLDILNSVQGQTGAPESAGFTGIGQGLAIAFNVVMGIGIGIGFASLAYAFILYILSQGDPKAVQRAFNAVTWSIIAICVTIGSWLAKNLALNALGVTDSSLINIPNF
ncbi:hypothetical protein A3K42_00685 [candidate division WWE3 bacterium RBG_13_37_7]|uniref:Uncharacterized protein n=1 Tax=candidate division WWE3 bacterium RBG_13_37_7 TaxID=1802609 RepID=A0A1F4U2G3_UNCKA|nr:MAG: hypothetical protein A3K42_00685 [candidate division WWE3 bacterium RBG_13_37_7]